MLLTLLVNFQIHIFFVDNFQNNEWPKQPTICERPIPTLELEKRTIQQKYSVPIHPASGRGKPLSRRGWGLFRRLYLEHLWGWWAVPHVEHGGWSGSPPWVALIPTTVPYVTNLRRESVQSDPDMTLNSPHQCSGSDGGSVTVLCCLFLRVHGLLLLHCQLLSWREGS